MFGIRFEGKDLALAGVFSAMGYFFTQPDVLACMASQNPFYGFVIYEVILIGVLLILSKLGLTVFGVRIGGLKQTVGIWLITSAFFMTVNWTNPWVQLSTMGADGSVVSSVFYNSEDGAAWWIWSQLLPSASAEQLRWLALVITPGLTGLLGGLLVTGRPRLEG